MRRFAVGDLVVADGWGPGTVLKVSNDFFVMGHYFVEFQRYKPRKFWVDVNRWVWQWTEQMWFQNYQLRPITLLDALAVASAPPPRP